MVKNVSIVWVLKSKYSLSYSELIHGSFLKYFTKNPKRGNFPQILKKIVDGKNQNVNPLYKLRPAEVNYKNNHLVFDRLYLNYYERSKNPLLSRLVIKLD